MSNPSMYKKVLVTGGSGLVGKAIQRISNQYYFHFIFLSSQDADLKSYDQTLACFQEKKPDYVIHLAAQVGGLYKNMNHQVTMLEDNLLMNLNVLKVCHQLNIQKVICCLSTCIYPSQVTYPIQEEMLHQGPPHNSNYGYSYAKRMLEVQCRAYQECFKRDYLCVIPTNIYGEDDNFSLENGHLIPALIHQCYLSHLKGTPFPIKGSGQARRQFIYAPDLAKIIIWMLEGYSGKDSLIACPPGENEYSVLEVAELIRNNFETKPEITLLKEYPEGQMKKTVNAEKLHKLLPEFQFTTLEKGIEKTVKWFRETYPKCRL